MIEIPRPLVRVFRTVLRQSLPQRTSRNSWPFIVIDVRRDHLTLRAQHADAAIAFRLPGPFNPQRLVLPAEALEDFGGRIGKVALDAGEGNQVSARWDDGSPRVKTYPACKPPENQAVPLNLPTLVTNPPNLLKALHDAALVTAQESTRFSTTKLQLRGNGEIVATDGRQLLVQGGFQFPWKEPVLIPKLSLFGAGLLPEDTPVQVGRTDKHVVLQLGSWTVHLTADTEGKFPSIESVIPNSLATRWTIPPETAESLIQTLPRLPGAEDDDSPITLDLNGKVFIRAREAGQSRQAELSVEESRVKGPAVRLATNRAYLLRALQLGFHGVGIVNADTVLVCSEAQRKYLWMPLPKQAALAPSADAIQIKPSKPEQRQGPAPTLRKKAVSPVKVNEDKLPAVVPVPEAKPSVPFAPLKLSSNAECGSMVEAVQALQNVLRDALLRVNQLSVAIKQQHRQSRIVHSALSSLRHLQRG